MVISGLDTEDMAVKATAQGAIGYLTKGPDLTRLADDLHRLIGAPVTT